LWANDTVSYGYHPTAPRLRTALTVQQPSGSWSQSYGYDLDSQLASAVGTGGESTENLGYTYDAGWNLAQRTQNGVPTAFQADALNRLTSVGAASYTYDSNGNLTGENGGANRNFTYDDESRLVSVMWGSGWYLTEFTYDGLGRMRKRVEKYYSGGQYSTYDTVYYVYDGMRVVQERNSSNTPTVAYTRGNDLSGSLEGAGGIGGLLARSDQYSGGSWNRHVFYHADGNGNITALANSAGTLQALYRYDPYGRATYTWGPLGGANVYRFSSKMFHSSSGLYHYGYRFYDPNTQRWLNRDPIEEDGGINLYRFAGNEPVMSFDSSGLAEQQRRKNNSQVIIVGPCEVVVLVGHGDQERPHTFLMPTGRPAAAGFIGCGADATNKRIAPGYMLDGAPVGRPWTGNVSDKDPAYAPAYAALVKSAREAAREMLRSSQCPKGRHDHLSLCASIRCAARC